MSDSMVAREMDPGTSGSSWSGVGVTAVVASAGLLRDWLAREGALRLVTGLRYRFLNAAAERLYGRPSVEVVGRGLLELFPSVVGLGIFACYVEPLRTGRPSAMRVPSFDDNGLVGAFDVAAHPYAMGSWWPRTT